MSKSDKFAIFRKKEATPVNKKVSTILTCLYWLFFLITVGLIMITSHIVGQCEYIINPMKNCHMYRLIGTVCIFAFLCNLAVILHIQAMYKFESQFFKTFLWGIIIFICFELLPGIVDPFYSLIVDETNILAGGIRSLILFFAVAKILSVLKKEKKLSEVILPIVIASFTWVLSFRAVSTVRYISRGSDLLMYWVHNFQDSLLITKILGLIVFVSLLIYFYGHLKNNEKIKQYSVGGILFCYLFYIFLYYWKNKYDVVLYIVLGLAFVLFIEKLYQYHLHKIDQELVIQYGYLYVLFPLISACAVWGYFAYYQLKYPTLSQFIQEYGTKYISRGECGDLGTLSELSQKQLLLENKFCAERTIGVFKSMRHISKEMTDKFADCLKKQRYSYLKVYASDSITVFEAKRGDCMYSKDYKSPYFDDDSKNTLYDAKAIQEELENLEQDEFNWQKKWLKENTLEQLEKEKKVFNTEWKNKYHELYKNRAANYEERKEELKKEIQASIEKFRAEYRAKAQAIEEELKEHHKQWSIKIKSLRKVWKNLSPQSDERNQILQKIRDLYIEEQKERTEIEVKYRNISRLQPFQKSFDDLIKEKYPDIYFWDIQLKNMKKQETIERGLLQKWWDKRRNEIMQFDFLHNEWQNPSDEEIAAEKLKIKDEAQRLYLQQKDEKKDLLSYYNDIL